MHADVLSVVFMFSMGCFFFHSTVTRCRRQPGGRAVDRWQRAGAPRQRCPGPSRCTRGGPSAGSPGAHQERREAQRGGGEAVWDTLKEGTRIKGGKRVRKRRFQRRRPWRAAEGRRGHAAHGRCWQRTSAARACSGASIYYSDKSRRAGEYAKRTEHCCFCMP